MPSQHPFSFRIYIPLLIAGSAAAFAACGNSPGIQTDSDSDSDSGADDISGDVSINDNDGGTDSGQGGAGGQSTTVKIERTLPSGFTRNVALPGEPQPYGGWKLAGPLKDVDQAGTACGNVLRVVARDMQNSHPDFGSGEGDDLDIVTDKLGSDRKPVYKDSDNVDSFEDWYNNVDGVNQPFVLDLWLEPVGKPETFVFDSGSFFPLDDVGYDETATADDGRKHRFLFTTELHTKFQYKGGETFTFRGDDDVFVYINGNLVVNLGGIHLPRTGSVNLDEKASEIGIEKGKVYSFDLFQAERKPTGSNFRIETTLDFTGCGEILPNDVVR